ncbi:CCA tRNA nucleotidyltransferase [Phaeocystidibacter luteus]|uniref:HD domain-containing protein n=1 Tax=Phaeocystidibacter luteus TaxID=911197 RepID=A0A6N6RMU1_9FLAO|nr:HD domain-containing protein [Phaeocystidibacter luteus]KAB2814885.1 HD domain-containing protein [Phaeocystidibacter luteus]
MNTEKIQTYVSSPIFKTIGECADELGVSCYVIGGYVRDRLLNRGKGKDLDIVVVGSGIEVAKKVAKALPGKNPLSVFKNFGTAQVKHGDLEIEFVGARKESYRSDSRKPLVEDGTLEDDQNRRDFTINALAIGLSKGEFGELLDPFNGIEDLKNGIIRTPLEPEITYSDDPLRMMRAVRFATQLNFEIEAESLAAIEKSAKRLKIISQERIMDEFNKIMLAPKPSIGLALLHNTKLLHQFLPELISLKGVEEVEGQTHKDNFWHTLEVVDNISKNTENLWARWAALLHDIGKPNTKKFIKGTGWTFHGHEFLGSKMVPKLFKRLKLPMNDKMKLVQKLVRMSSRPTAVVSDDATDSAIRRLLFDAGDDIELLMILCEADITTKNNRKKNRYLKNYQLVRSKLVEVEEKDRIRNWQPPIDGAEIMSTFDLPPGKEIGMIKKAIREAILDGIIPNEYEAAKGYMIEKGTELGLTPKAV